MTNEAKPSEVAMGIAREVCWFPHSEGCMVPGGPCSCGSERDYSEAALAIDAAIADAVRKEAEECAKAMAEKSAEYAALIDNGQGVWPGPDYVRNDIWVDWGARRSAFEQAERAIRARNTTDSKEQPR